MFDGREPIYLQIADQVRQDAVSGVLAEEEQVMSTTPYATTYRVNPATAAKAFAQLTDQGVLDKRRGVGTFVSSGARTRLVADRRERFFADVLEPWAVEARMLDVPLDDVLARLRRLDADHETVAADEEQR